MCVAQSAALTTSSLTANDVNEPNKTEPFGWVFVQVKQA